MTKSLLSALVIGTLLSGTASAESVSYRVSNSCETDRVWHFQEDTIEGLHELEFTGPNGEAMQVQLELVKQQGQTTITSSKLFTLESRRHGHLSRKLVSESNFENNSDLTHGITYKIGGFFEPESIISLSLSPVIDAHLASYQDLTPQEGHQTLALSCQQG